MGSVAREARNICSSLRERERERELCYLWAHIFCTCITVVCRYGKRLVPSVKNTYVQLWTEQSRVRVPKSASTREPTQRNTQQADLPSCTIFIIINQLTRSSLSFTAFAHFFNQQLIKYDSSCYYRRRHSCRNCQCLHT